MIRCAPLCFTNDGIRCLYESTSFVACISQKIPRLQHVKKERSVFFMICASTGGMKGTLSSRFTLSSRRKSRKREAEHVVQGLAIQSEIIILEKTLLVLSHREDEANKSAGGKDVVWSCAGVF